MGQTKNNVLFKSLSIILSFLLVLVYFPLDKVRAEETKTLVSIEVSTQPKIKEYVVGDTFNTKGLKVVANYSDGSFAYVSNASLQLSYDFAGAGDKEVTISYTEKDVTKNDSVVVKVYEKPSLVVENTTAKKGDIITIPVSISDNVGLMGIKIVVSYDSSVLKPLSVDDTDYFINGYVNDNISTSTDSSFYVIWNGTENITADGKLFSVSFMCLAEPPEGKTLVNVSADKNDTFTENYGIISMNSAQSVITIEGLKGIVVNHTGVVLRKGSKLQESVETTPEGLDVEWESMDTSIASVDETGKITGVSSGKTIIKASLKEDSDIYKEIEVEVLDSEEMEHEHEWSETILKEASCKEEGKKAYYCSICGESYVETVDKLSHTEEIIPGIAPTCTEKGKTSGKKCSVCGEILEAQSEIAAIGHRPVTDPAVAATTTSTGLTEGSHCSVCGTIIKAQSVVPKLVDTSANTGGNSGANANTKQRGANNSTTTKNVNKFEKTSSGTRYYKSDGKLAKSEWVTINGVKYYFNSDGYAASNEWRDGKWISKDGSCTYSGILKWKSNSTGWWIEDTAGWYPTSSWQKIDGVWYYFNASGYMASNEYYNGYWFNKNGSWDPKYKLSWKSNASGWWVEDKSGWWPSNSWLKIDGNWYYFNGSGYMAASQYVDGWWVGSDGVCR